jgi:Fe-S-cluster containining protein
MQEPFRDIVIRTAGRDKVIQAIGQLYGRLEQEIARRRPVCVASGRCCRFEEYGHRLYITTMELADFMHRLADRTFTPQLAQAVTGWDGRGCPFQTGGLCGVHDIRPLGCRMYFCDASSTDWQQEQYELFHKELKNLHQELDVPYFYMEWREALAAMGVENHREDART